MLNLAEYNELRAPAPLDPITAAYVAMGAAEWWRDHPRESGEVADAYGGQESFMAEVMEGARVLRELAAEAEAEGGWWSGVYAYEVAEPFGIAYASVLAKGGGIADAAPLARELIAAAWIN